MGVPPDRQMFEKIEAHDAGQQRDKKRLVTTGELTKSLRQNIQQRRGKHDAGGEGDKHGDSALG